MEEMVELFCHFMDSNIVSGKRLGIDESALYAISHRGGAIGGLTSLSMCLKIDAGGRIQDATVKPEYGQTFPSSGFSNTGVLNNCQFGKVPRARLPCSDVRCPSNMKKNGEEFGNGDEDCCEIKNCGDFDNEDCDGGKHVDYNNQYGSTPGECCVDNAPAPAPAPSPPPPPRPPRPPDERVVVPPTPVPDTKKDKILNTRMKPNHKKRRRRRLRGNSKKSEMSIAAMNRLLMKQDTKLKQATKLKRAHPHRGLQRSRSRRKSKGDKQLIIRQSKTFRVMPHHQPPTTGDTYRNARRKFVPNKPSGGQVAKIRTQKKSKPLMRRG
jgi:hypothetical protein